MDSEFFQILFGGVLFLAGIWCLRKGRISVNLNNAEKRPGESTHAYHDRLDRWEVELTGIAARIASVGMILGGVAVLLEIFTDGEIESFAMGMVGMTVFLVVGVGVQFINRLRLSD